MSNLISFPYQNTEVFFHNDAWLNATSIANRFNKQPRDYLKTNKTKDYIEAVRRNLFNNTAKTNVLLKENQLVKIVNGGNTKEHGTWLHPKLAIDFARWLNPDFAVWCDLQIEKILRKSYGLKELPEPQTITKTQQGELYTLVNNKADNGGKQHAYYWSRFNKHFKLSSYKNLPYDKFEEGIDYLKRLEGDNEDSLITIDRASFRQLTELDKPKPLTILINQDMQSKRYIVDTRNGSTTISPVPENAAVLTREEIIKGFDEIMPGYSVMKTSQVHHLIDLVKQLTAK